MTTYKYYGDCHVHLAFALLTMHYAHNTHTSIIKSTHKYNYNAHSNLNSHKQTHCKAVLTVSISSKCWPVLNGEQILKYCLLISCAKGLSLQRSIPSHSSVPHTNKVSKGTVVWLRYLVGQREVIKTSTLYVRAVVQSRSIKRGRERSRCHYGSEHRKQSLCLFCYGYHKTLHWVQWWY